MNQTEIGKFIAKCRKEKKLTQAQLAEKLNITVSVFIIPYLFLLSRFVKTKEVFSIGTAMAMISIIFLWIIAAVFWRTRKTRMLTAWGISFLLAIPFMFIVNIVLSQMIADPILDIWDMLSVFILLISAFVSFVCDYAKKKRMAT